MDTLTIEDMHEAAKQLARSGRGRSALKALLAWLDTTGVGLDLENQEAVCTLLDGAWGPFTGSARDAMREALGEES